jgi:nucleotide-binding universal stress UspA family protein
MDQAFLAPEARFNHAMGELRRLKPDETGILTDYLLRQGRPVEEILRAGEERHCDIIVLGTHGRSGLGWVIMGSIAEAVLRRAACPVVTVRSDASLKTLRTILYATDLSELSDHAFPVARALARDHQASLVILHVYPPPISHAEEVARRPPDSYVDALWEAMHRYKVSDAAVAVRHRLAVGDPAKEIVRAAQELKCDLVVLGTQGRTGLRRVLMGSVAENVLRRAPCPVVTIGPAALDGSCATGRVGVCRARPAAGAQRRRPGQGHAMQLIALATHGRRGLGRLLLGSVADKALRGASVPVLLRRSVEDSSE